MSPATLTSFVVAAATLSLVAAQSTYPATPLAQKTFAYPNGIPYQADTDPTLIRGGQFGFNICNSTTQGQTSNCQTNIFNGIDDFCLWAPPEANSVVANTEGEMVAWCTKPGHGTRLIPDGALKGVQWIRTPDYVQAAGYVDQSMINLQGDDYGGEMDPHGADLRGNPLGGLVYTNAWSGDANTYGQAFEWHNFIGSNFFCFKICDPRGAHAADYCQHIYDRIGCTYNAPTNVVNGTFEVCDGDSQDFPGVYTENGVVMTYTQPAESLGPISTMPYTAKVPASSNCVPHASTDLYAALASVHAPAASGSAAAHTGASGSAAHASGSASKTGSAGAPKNTNANAASSVTFSAISLIGSIVAAIYLS